MGTMRCSNCGRKMADSRWKQCDSCRKFKRKTMREHRAKDPEAAKAYLASYNQQRRRKVIEHYGGRCECCGVEQYEFLVLDHVNGGGSQHRKGTGMRGAGMIGWIIRNGYPDDFQVLCWNCNQARGYYGRCPHEAE